MTYSSVAVFAAWFAAMAALMALLYVVDRLRYWRNRSQFFEAVCEGYEKMLGFTDKQG